MVRAFPSPWEIPTQRYLDDISKICGIDLQRNDHRVKHRFSAAAAAISFLQSMPRRSRLHVRKIILDEDHKSIGSPESHIRGLVPFCIENPALRIQRQVDAWRAVFPGEDFPLQTPIVFTLPRQMNMYDGVTTDMATHAIARWLTEAMTLQLVGMPSKSFSLQFFVNSNQDVFEELKRGAAWQCARQESYVRNLLPQSSIWNERNGPFYFSESFPGAVRDIIEGNSFIHFDVAPGELWNIDNIIEINRGCSEEGWTENWLQSRGTLRTKPPLLSWSEILREYILPDPDELMDES